MGPELSPLHPGQKRGEGKGQGGSHWIEKGVHEVQEWAVPSWGEDRRPQRQAETSRLLGSARPPTPHHTGVWPLHKRRFRNLSKWTRALGRIWAQGRGVLGSRKVGNGVCSDTPSWAQSQRDLVVPKDFSHPAREGPSMGKNNWVSLK